MNPTLMTKQERSARDVTFEEYRDGQNKVAEEKAFLHSLGLTADPEVAGKRKTVKQEVEGILEKAFKTVDAALAATAPTEEPENITLNLRQLLMKDLAPFLRKDKAEAASMMDLSTLGLHDESKIRGFLQRHGINLDRPADLQYAIRAFQEAANFFDDHIAQNGQPKINSRLRKMSNAQDIYNVFKTSAGHGTRQLTPQACALLRIAMVIDFMEKDPLISALPQVQDELRSTVHRHVRKVGNSHMYHSGNPQEKPIPLIAAEARVKSRARVIMKLLHKASNSTSEVVDHIGYRFVTESASDSLRLIYQMFFDHNSSVLPAMNIRIGRTKQSLVDPQVLMNALKDNKRAQELFQQLSVETINHQDVESQPLTGTDNGHSSKQYRAIHITVDFPVVVNGNQMFFPIEIQFVDKNARRGNEELAPHENYTARQCEAAGTRLLSNNLLTNYQARRNAHSKKAAK